MGFSKQSVAQGGLCQGAESPHMTKPIIGWVGSVSRLGITTCAPVDVWLPVTLAALAQFQQSSAKLVESEWLYVDKLI